MSCAVGSNCVGNVSRERTRRGWLVLCLAIRPLGLSDASIAAECSSRGRLGDAPDMCGRRSLHMFHPQSSRNEAQLAVSKGCIDRRISPCSHHVLPRPRIRTAHNIALDTGQSIIGTEASTCRA